MRPTHILPHVRALLLAALVLLPPNATRAAAPAPPAALPDSFVLARVGPRTITVYNFCERYFASDATIRPRGDSLGRVEFLDAMVRKEVLGTAALKAGYTFGFEERAAVRDYHNELLSNMLYMRVVRDSSSVTEDSLRHVAQFYGRELRLRVLFFTTRAEAEHVRLQLIGGRMPWSAALAKYAVKSATFTDGVSGWLKFDALPVEVALPIWPLRLGETSPVIPASNGYHVVQIAEERSKPAPPYNALRHVLKLTLRGAEADTRRQAIQRQAKDGLNVVYDTTNVLWAASFFKTSMEGGEGLGTSIVVNDYVPDFTPADTGRTIVTWKDGRLSLGDIMHAYSDMQPMMRPSLNAPERMMAFADAVMLGPRMVEFAQARGLDKDPVVVRLMDLKREELMVTRMVEDSVLNRVSVTKDERQAYYHQHERDFYSYPVVRYASFVRHSKAGADSLKALLDAGANADSLVGVDTAHHVVGTGTDQLQSSVQSDYHKILFEELRPGRSTIIGPDKEKLYAVMHEISYDPGKLVPYDQVVSSIDESVRNIKGDALLRAFADRLAKRVKVESHPELLMRFPLVDPAGADD